MSQAIKYVAIFIAGGVLCWILFKGCGKDSSIQKLQDSLNISRQLNDTLKSGLVESHKTTDSIKLKNKYDSLRYTQKIDSQQHIISVLSGRFKVTKDSISVLYASLKDFYLRNDTADLIRTYNDLKQQLTYANAQLFLIQVARDSADNIRDSEIVRLRGVITQLQNQIAQLQNLLKQSTDNSSRLAKVGAQAIKREKINGLLAKVGGGIVAILAAIIVFHK